MSISKISDVIPVAVQHPIFLDVASREAMEDTGEPMSPLSFRGFRLHIVWTQQPGGESIHQISFPCLLGEGSSSLLEYESEKFPLGLRQGQKRALNLKPPSTDHWTIASDLILPLTLDESRQQCEAKQAAQGLEGRSEGAKVSPTKATTPGKSPQHEAGGSGAAPPQKTTPHRERVLEATHEILAHVHTLCLQTMHEIGSVWELDRTLAQTLLAELVRLHLIIGEDFTKSLIALRTDLEASCEVLLSDIVRTLNLHPDNPTSRQVKATLLRFQQATSLKVNLLLMELQVAQEEMEEFLQNCLREISSQTESRELIEELSQKLSTHASRVWELVQVPKLAEEEVSHRVLIGLAMDQPLEANFFPGILEGLARRLGLMPPGVTDPPTSSRAGVSRRWAATLRDVIRTTEGRDVDLDRVMHTMMPPGLHLDHDLDFQTRRVDDIAPTLTSPLLSGLVDNICQLENPAIPGKPASFKADEGLWGLVGGLLSQMHRVHLTMMVWPPRCQLAKGRSKKLNLGAQRRAPRISLFSSLTRRNS